MKNKHIIIAGGTGFIGQGLVKYFGKDNHITILSRRAVNSHNNSYNHHVLLPADGYDVTYRRWDGEHVEKHWSGEFEAADIVINLAGKSVNCRYNEKNKREIFNSRTNATKAIGEAIRQCIVPPKLWINAASATIYRHAEDRPQDEYNGEFENDFSVQVCKKWEQSFAEQRTAFTRKVALRTGITLGTGGVMIPYFNLLKYALGGKQGSGNQMYTWVHMEDVCRVVEWLYDHHEMEGTFNLTAPNPVTNKYFMDTLRKITGHKIGLPAYKWMLKIGATLIGTEPELILKSRWVVPTKLLENGFTFRYASINDAIKNIIDHTERRRYHLF